MTTKTPRTAYRNVLTTAAIKEKRKRSESGESALATRYRAVLVENKHLEAHVLDMEQRYNTAARDRDAYSRTLVAYTEYWTRACRVLGESRVCMRHITEFPDSFQQSMRIYLSMCEQTYSDIVAVKLFDPSSPRE